MPTKPIPTPQPGDFVGAICPACGAWGVHHCTTSTGRDHPSRTRAEAAWNADLDREFTHLTNTMKETR
ncbi:hypothetical protein [Microbacterium sp. VKM Ac-2923]|uniref:hypothetical protein n=1 Tax=Microbacterium sp. VKM Ac-2923 TaxID=2929476 RepID=UPI001FB3B684|nr:hypothetical protein [Microbacterium sp. VKM Ac-2923]MCJ1709264.1 hypothetical protein [Microbacterium sp. VKM Ac-2923]